MLNITGNMLEDNVFAKAMNEKENWLRAEGFEILLDSLWRHYKTNQTMKVPMWVGDEIKENHVCKKKEEAVAAYVEVIALRFLVRREVK
jgi:hypothetical protein